MYPQDTFILHICRVELTHVLIVWYLKLPRRMRKPVRKGRDRNRPGKNYFSNHHTWDYVVGSMARVKCFWTKSRLHFTKLCSLYFCLPLCSSLVDVRFIFISLISEWSLLILKWKSNGHLLHQYQIMKIWNSWSNSIFFPCKILF